MNHVLVYILFTIGTFPYPEQRLRLLEWISVHLEPQLWRQRQQQVSQQMERELDGYSYAKHVCKKVIMTLWALIVDSRQNVSF